MKSAGERILSVAEAFEKISGRKYGFFEEYRMEDAEMAVVVIGSSAGTGKDAVDQLRAAGVKAGLLKIRVFRPFPMKEVAAALSGLKAVAVMDKSEGFSACGGPLFAEVRSALYDLADRPKCVNYVYGLGGRDVTVGTYETIFGELAEILRTGDVGQVYRHIGQREDAVMREGEV